MEAGEVAQQFTSLAALLEEPGWALSTHTEAHNHP